LIGSARWDGRTRIAGTFIRATLFTLGSQTRDVERPNADAFSNPFASSE
jgi:hypothetical protein